MTVWDLLLYAGLFAAILFTEFVLLYASTALGNVDWTFAKGLIGSVLAAVVWAGLAFGAYKILAGGGAPFATENRAVLLGVTGGALAGSWLLLTAAFVPVFPMSLPRGMLVSVFQLLLRLFLYVLIGAVVMVVLAVLQIRLGSSDKLSAAPDVNLSTTRAA